jgi:hypothetical protein
MPLHGKPVADPHGPFIAKVLENPYNRKVLERLPQLKLPDSWLVAGSLFQTVWNLRAGLPPAALIKDYDIFYFDPTDLSEAGELEIERKTRALFADLPIVIEVKNQARVHMWYEDWFGHSYSALKSSRDAIDRFLVTCTCVGLAPGEAGAPPELYAPNGVQELESGVLRPNPKCDHPDLFQAKAASYRERWPWLRLA